MRGAPFHTLGPWSSAGYVWEYTLVGAPAELEVQEALARNAQVRLILISNGGSKGGGTRWWGHLLSWRCREVLAWNPQVCCVWWLHCCNTKT